MVTLFVISIHLFYLYTFFYYVCNIFLLIWQSLRVWTIFFAYRYAEYGTILEIKDRVLMKDGCSILSTVGGRRFRVLSGGERDGYDTAQVELLRDSPVQIENLRNLTELHDKVGSR